MWLSKREMIKTVTVEFVVSLNLFFQQFTIFTRILDTVNFYREKISCMYLFMKVFRCNELVD